MIFRNDSNRVLNELCEQGKLKCEKLLQIADRTENTYKKLVSEHNVEEELMKEERFVRFLVKFYKFF